MIYVFLATGFEEIEAVTPIDLLRRADKKVVTVGIGGNTVTGSHGISISTDIVDAEFTWSSDVEMIVLPGGMPGTLNLKKSEAVKEAIKCAVEYNRYIAAICAAPSILGELGVLKKKNAVCYPGFEEKLLGANITKNSVEVDKNIITAKGAGVTLDFSIKLIELLAGDTAAEKIYDSLQCKK